MNNRLDYIASFEDGAIEKMTALRNKYIELDNELKELMFVDDLKLTTTPNEALRRTISLARTNIETSLQYAIKSLCLKFEKKPE